MRGNKILVFSFILLLSLSFASAGIFDFLTGAATKNIDLCGNGICDEGEATSSCFGDCIESRNCTDTDSGLEGDLFSEIDYEGYGGYNVLVKGTIDVVRTWKDGAVDNFPQTDVCSSDGLKVQEFYCSNSVKTATVFPCSNLSPGSTCVDGACINVENTDNDTGNSEGETTNNKCIDSDGKDYYNKGYVKTVNNIIKQDICDINNVIERYCEDNEIKNESYNCPSECYNGACILRGVDEIDDEIISEYDCNFGEECIVNSGDTVDVGGINVSAIVSDRALNIWVNNSIIFDLLKGEIKKLDNGMTFLLKEKKLMSENVSLGSATFILDKETIPEDDSVIITKESASCEFDEDCIIKDGKVFSIGKVNLSIKVIELTSRGITNNYNNYIDFFIDEVKINKKGIKKGSQEQIINTDLGDISIKVKEIFISNKGNAALFEISKIGELIEEDIGNCDGCIINNKCYSKNKRVGDEYCAENEEFLLQQKLGVVCDNNFECSSNACIDSKCVDLSFWQKITNWLGFT